MKKLVTNSKDFMKLITVLTFAAITLPQGSFAQTATGGDGSGNSVSLGCEFSCSQVNEGSVFLKAIAGISNVPQCANVKKVFSRTCVVSTPDQSVYFENKSEGLEIVEECKIVMRAQKEGRVARLSANERKAQRQDLEIEKKLIECNQNL